MPNLINWVLWEYFTAVEAMRQDKNLRWTLLRNLALSATLIVSLLVGLGIRAVLDNEIRPNQWSLSSAAP